MDAPEPTPATGSAMAAAAENYRRRFILCFGLFFVFFVFYLGTAIIQTPACRHIASIPCCGMPLGLFLSLMIFPVSWALIAVFFLKWR